MAQCETFCGAWQRFLYNMGSHNRLRTHVYQSYFRCFNANSNHVKKANKGLQTLFQVISIRPSKIGLNELL